MSEEQSTILIIEDDPRMQKVLHRIFHDEGYKVEVASDGRLGVDAFTALQPCAVVLDLILPQLSGREVCKRIKSASPDTPVIILSAVSEVVDKVLLLARVQASIRRRRKSEPVSTYRFGDCEIDFLKMIARKGGKVISLTAHEFKLLRFFTKNPERVLSRDELLSDVWGYNSYPTTRTVDNQILKLRQKLESDPASPRHLQTIYGAGYKFTP
jgi:DNA-binding response OmpR family regulator